MRDLTKVNTLVFDFDYTLANREIAAYTLFYELLKGYEKDNIYLESMIQDCMIWDEHGTASKYDTIKKLEGKYNLDLGIDDFNEYWDNNLSKYTVLYDETIEVLDKLKEKGYKLGIITNGSPHGQRNKLKKAGIIPYFDSIKYGGDYKLQKPDTGIFLDSLKELGSKPEESMYIGDIYSNDVIGAYNTGMIPVLIWRHGFRMHKSEAVRVSSLKELTELLGVE